MITDNFIKMCEKAKEIQKECKYIMGDWLLHLHYFGRNDSHFEVLENSIESQCVVDKIKKDGVVWLPTQEQLQEMMLKPKNTLCPDIFTLIALLGVFAAVNEYYNMNELWLAFVMKEKYNKIWNGKDWKNE